MKEMSVHDELASLVPPPSRHPVMPDLVARAKRVQRRRTAALASAAVAVVMALATAAPALDVFEDAGDTSNVAANDPGRTGSAGYLGGGSDLGLDCGADDGVTAGTVYAPPVFETARVALENELDRRRVSVTADDFAKVHETDDEVHYEVRRDEKVQAIAVVSRSAGGWTLDLLLTCATLDE